jgi:hypothetical protein
MLHLETIYDIYDITLELYYINTLHIKWRLSISRQTLKCLSDIPRLMPRAAHEEII